MSEVLPAARAGVPLVEIRGLVRRFETGGGTVATVTKQGTRLFINPYGHKVAFALVPQSATRFELQETAGTVEFVSAQGKPTTARVVLAGLDRTGEKQP